MAFILITGGIILVVAGLAMLAMAAMEPDRRHRYFGAGRAER